ncbi:MAG: hypothetical protein ACJ8FP_05670 [Xanthobacteraceae bacterium]
MLRFDALAAERAALLHERGRGILKPRIRAQPEAGHFSVTIKAFAFGQHFRIVDGP